MSSVEIHKVFDAEDLKGIKCQKREDDNGDPYWIVDGMYNVPPPDPSEEYSVTRNSDMYFKLVEFSPKLPRPFAEDKVTPNSPDILHKIGRLERVLPVDDVNRFACPTVRKDNTALAFVLALPNKDTKEYFGQYTSAKDRVHFVTNILFQLNKRLKTALALCRDANPDKAIRVGTIDKVTLAKDESHRRHPRGTRDKLHLFVVAVVQVRHFIPMEGFGEQLITYDEHMMRHEQVSNSEKLRERILPVRDRAVYSAFYEQPSEFEELSEFNSLIRVVEMTPEIKAVAKGDKRQKAAKSDEPEFVGQFMCFQGDPNNHNADFINPDESISPKFVGEFGSFYEQDSNSFEQIYRSLKICY